MAKIVLTWSNDSNIHSHQKIYKSLTVFDSNTLPSDAVTIGRYVRVYEDTDVVEGFTYYYAVATVDWNGAEYLSDVLEVEAVEGDGDPYWDNVVALLHFDGDLTDETGRVWTKNGSAVVSTIDPKFGSGSLSVPGTSGYIQTPSELIAGAEGNRVTVELFIKIRTLTRTGIIFDFRPPNTYGNYLGGWYTAAGELAVHINGADTTVTPAGTVTASNEWVHYAVVVDGSILKVFLGGVMVGSFVGVNNYIASNHGLVGRSAYVNSTSFPDAVFDELRITKGVARYTENFIPPTEPFPNYGA